MDIQSLAAAEVRASHRIACLDAILAAELNVTTVGGILDWIDQVMAGRSVKQVLALARARKAQHLAWPAPGVKNGVIVDASYWLAMGARRAVGGGGGTR